MKRFLAAVVVVFGLPLSAAAQDDATQPATAPVMKYARQTTGPHDAATLQVTRKTTDSGQRGTAYNFYADTVVNPGAANNEIVAQHFIDNHGTGFGIAGGNEAWRENGAGGVWGGIDEVQDLAPGGQASGGEIGREIDVEVAGPDLYHNRGGLMFNVSNLVRGHAVGGPGEVSWGLLFASGDPSQQKSYGKFDNYMLFQSNFNTGLDFSVSPAASHDKPVLVMAAGQKIMFDTAHGGAWRYAAGANAPGRMQYINSQGAELFSVDDNGLASLHGANIAGHVISTGPAPHVSGGALDATATDHKGTVTEASGATGFTLNFAAAYATAPDCVVSSPTGSSFSRYTPSTTGLTLANPAGNGNQYSYICEQ